MISGLRRAVIFATVAAAVVAPLVILAVQGFTGRVHVAEVVLGAWVGTAFFAISGFVAARGRVENLKSTMLRIYVYKISGLMAVWLLFPADRWSRDAFAVSIVVSSVCYLAVQIAVLQSRRAPG